MFCPEYNVLYLGQIQYNTLLSTTLHMFKDSCGCIMLWVCLSLLKTGEEYLVKSVFHQTLGGEFTFQQDNNLKHKAKSTLELLTKKTVNVTEWSSYSFLTYIYLKNL